MDSERPIGVFDSGVGGLSVLREIRRELPHEDLLYVADSAYAPYGDQTAAFIEERSCAIVRFLVQQGAKAIVVACNTATGVAVSVLRSRFDVPIVAIEPALKPAAASTRSGVVGVLATSHTLGSSKFLRLVDTYAGNVKILIQPCPGFVEHVEQGDLSSPSTRSLVERHVLPLIRNGADTLVLGCTHYPFLSPIIHEVAGRDVALIDPATAVARQLRRRLEAGGRLAKRSQPGTERFWTSAPLDAAARVMSQLWMHAVVVDDLGILPLHP